ncbi:PIG-L family deacetylase [Pseudonocardia sp. NPDC049635]|uniref:PIG-L family deacetylase n=1 Tax=Pseudonocardia sp. NPDC049635 TaxID=3155506 RepID=UPI0033C02222
MATIVYAIPHQDDETLSMGASIRTHLDAGHEVHLLLLSTGVNSGVRTQLGLSRPRFTAARDDEFRRAAGALGVAPRRVHLSRPHVPDGALSVQAAQDAIEAWLAEHPGAWLKTYSHLSWPGRHADHSNTGQAAVNLLRSGVVDNLRLYVEPWQTTAFRAAHPGERISQTRAPRPERLRGALDEYARVGPGMYGIGYRSVRTAFDHVRGEQSSWYHLPPAAGR